MPKNNADPKMDRADNRADSKDELRTNAAFTEAEQTLTSDKAGDYVPSLNGVSKNVT